MKRKISIFLFILIFGFCGVFGFANLAPLSLFASSPSASVWEGSLSGDNFVDADNNDLTIGTTITGADFYSDGVSEVYIYSASGLAYFVNQVNGGNLYNGYSVYLETDIDWDNKAWKTIGSVSQSFNGVFYGQGYYIFNTTLSSGGNSGSQLGFFGALGSSASVSNLHLRNFAIDTDEMEFSNSINIGGITAFSNGATISNCSVKGNVNLSSTGTQKRNIGGIVGSGSGTISSCMTEIVFTTTGANNLGGIVGLSSGVTLSSVYSESTIFSNAGSVGGLVGCVTGTTSISNSYNIGGISTSTNGTGQYIGGLVGSVTGGTLNVNHTYNAGDITYNSAEGNFFAGLVGNSSAMTNIQHSFAIGALSKSSTSTSSSSSGELTEHLDGIYNGSGVTLTNVYCFENEKNAENLVKNLEILAKTRDFYRNTKYFSADWDFSTTWKISPSVNSSLPYLQLLPTNSDQDKSGTNLKGAGTAQSPYLIETAGDLSYIASLTSYGAHYSLQNDIDLTGKTWLPIGYNVNDGFSGVFDGNGHTISGITCSLQKSSFGYIGLFAQTNDAVIKNLTIGTARYIGGGTSANASLIGNVAGDTYIVNILDNSGTTLNTVGSVSSGNLYVVYGKNNVNISGTGIVDSTLSLGGLSYEVAYDITISGEGGTFYDTTTSGTLSEEEKAEMLVADNIYTGEFHVLVNGSGVVLSQTIDSTFGKTALPELSTSIGTADVLIRPGYKLSGYSYVGTGNSVGTTIGNCMLAVLGLKANWVKTDVTVKVVYNQYEIANFGAEISTLTYGSFQVNGKEYNISVDGTSKRVYVDYKIPYDTFLNESPYLFDVPQYVTTGGETAPLRGNFEIGALYSGFSEKNFAGTSYDSSSVKLLNDDFSTCLYAQWKTKEIVDLSNYVNIKFVTNDDKIDLTDLANILNSYSGSASTTGNKAEKVYVGTKDDASSSITFTYDFMYSASMDEWVNFALELNPGYTIAGSPSITRNGANPSNPNSGFDTNFGVLTITGGYDENGLISGINVISDISGINFYNLIGEYTITFEVKREVYNDTLLVQGDVLFGVSPLENFVVTKSGDGEGATYSSNLEIMKGYAYVDLLNVIDLSADELAVLADTNDLYVAFDVLNNIVLFSSSAFDGKMLSLNLTDNPEFYFKFSTQAGDKYFAITFEKETAIVEGEKIETPVFMLKEIDADTHETKESILKLYMKNGKYDSMQYIAFNSFVLVASTERDAVVFSSCEYPVGKFTDENMPARTSLREELQGDQLIDKAEKYLFEFVDAVKKENSSNTLTVVSEYTDATFDFEFLYDGTTPSNFDANRPVASFNTPSNSYAASNIQATYDVSSLAGGEIVLYVQESEYFRLSEPALGANLSVVVTNSNLSAEASADYEEKFNNEENKGYSKYLTLESVQLLRGVVENGIVLLNDTYKITLKYYGNTSANGLQAGHYTITIKCMDVLYSINYATKFMTNDSLKNLNDLDARTVNNYGFEDEGGVSAPLNLLTINGGTYNYDDNGYNFGLQDVGTGNIVESYVDEFKGVQHVAIPSFTGEKNIRYDDNLTFSVDTTNNEYVFYGLYVRGDSVKEIILASELNDGEYLTRFSQIYSTSVNASTNTTGERFQATVFAVYVKKQFNLTFDGNLWVEDENGEESADYRFITSSKGLDFNMELASGGTDHAGSVSGDVYSYDYSTSTTASALKITLNGENSAGYYFAGFKVVDEGRNAVTDVVGGFSISADGTMTIDMGALKSSIASGSLVTSSTSQTYYLEPIIKQKTAQLYFHSGTGDATNLYGDTKNGEVYNVDENETTGNIYTYGIEGQTLYFGNSLDLSSISVYLSGEEQTLTLLQLFNTRTGYERYTMNYWSWKGANGSSGTLTDSTVTMSANLFGAGDMAEVHFHLLWRPNTYTISYSWDSVTSTNGNALYGGANGTTASTGATYDEDVTLANNNFTFKGYTFKGWSRTQNATEEEYSAGQTLTAPNFTSTNGGSVTLYAVWEAKTYSVLLDFNSGTLGGDANKAYYIVYNTTFENLSGGAVTVALEEIIPARTGFTLDGFYVKTSDGQSVLVDNNKMFNSALPTFVDPTNLSTPAVTLYAKWNYISDFVSLELTENAKTLTYNGNTQTIYVADFFEGYESENITVTIANSALSYVIGATNVSHTVKLSSLAGSGDVYGNDMLYVQNAGNYVFEYSITISDGATHFNKGTLQTISIKLYITVEKANFAATIDEEIKVFNAKRLMAPFVNLGKNNISTFSDLATFVKTADGADAFESATDEEICDYITMKYLLLLQTNDGDMHKTYKNWTYSDFLGYVDEVGENSINSVLETIKFFTFYALPTSAEINEYKDFVALSADTAGVSSDLVVEKIQIYSMSSTFQARYSYELRAYLQKTSNIDNYNISRDGDGDVYFVLGRAYVMPMPFTATNILQNRSTYYSSAYENREVEWIYDGEEKKIDGHTYYKIGQIGDNSLFAYATLATSNAGSADETITYSFKDAENYLYFSHVKVQLVVGEDFYDYTSSFKFILDDDDTYSIMGIRDVVLFTLTAKYLTIVDDVQYCNEINSTNENLRNLASIPTSLLKAERVVYDLKDGNGERTAFISEHPNSFTASNGALIYEILSNNSNVVSLYLNTVVTNVIFSANSQTVGDYISLYKWIEDDYQDTGVDDNVVVNDSFTYDMADVNMATDTLTQVNCNAIYTDLVKANFNLNFPSTYRPTSSTQSFLRLGFTTADDFAFPAESGFKCVNLTLDGYDVDLMTENGRNQFFAGDDGTYVGINADSKREALTFNALWQMEEVEGTPLMTEYKTAVSSFDRLYYSEVVNLTNVNTKLFDYSYQWFKQDDDGEYSFYDGTGTEQKYSLLSSSLALYLDEKGSVNESGKYKLCINATLKEEFVSALADPSNAQSYFEVDFELEFIRNLLVSVTLADDTEIVYDGANHISSCAVVLNYRVYDRDLDDYSENAVTYEQGYSSSGSVYFEVYCNGDENNGTKMTEMKNVGTYFVYLRLSDGVFDLSSFTGNTSYTYTITPYEINLQDTDFDVEKIFNAVEPTLGKRVSALNESVDIKVQRVSGEDVGTYGIYLSDAQNSPNFNLKYGDVVLYENGTIKSDASSTAIGTFTIKNSSVLRLSYEGDGLVQVPYAVGGYTLSLGLVDDGKGGQELHFVISNTSEVVKSLKLTLYDFVQGMDVMDAEILDILYAHVDAITPKFFNSIAFEKVEDCAVYTYTFVLGEEFSKYYSSVEMTQAFQFEIMPIEIDVTSADYNGAFDKVYDGTKTHEVSAVGFDGVVIVANFSSIHVGQNISADLSLKSTNAGIKISNFKLKQTSIRADITKLSATLKLKIGTGSFEYGNVTDKNFAGLIEIDSVLAGEKDVENLLEQGYYSLSYSLGASVKKNAQGFLYVGTYTVDATASTFQDFAMTIENLTFTVIPRTFNIQIPENYIVITTSDEVASSYAKTQTISETGDEIEFDFVVLNENLPVTSGKLPTGQYALTVDGAVIGRLTIKLGSDDVQGSVIAVVPENTGFTVVQATATLYVSIDDESVLMQTYNGAEFVLSTTQNEFSVSNGGGTSVLSFFTFDNSGNKKEVTDTGIASISIYNGADITALKNVGTNILKLQATWDNDNFSNIVFDKEYKFVIAQRTINVANLTIAKTFDMSASMTITNFDEKVTGDNVSILAQFDSYNVGTSKTVTLSLQGTGMNNYVLSATTTTGTISKATATISLTKTTFTYGEIMLTNGTLNNTISSNVSVLDTGGKTVSTSQYTLEILISDGVYSALGYLQAGEYSVTISNTKTDTNYDCSPLTDTITISPYTLSNITFTTEGAIKVEYGTTLDGFNVPYTIPSNSTNSPLKENISFILLRQSDETSIGNYKLVDDTYTSIDGNYVVTITDSSDGAFEITKPSAKLYVMFDEAAENVDNTKSIPQFSIVYDGNVYDAVKLEENEGKFYLVVYNSTFESVKQSVALAFYSLESGVYVKYDGQVQGLSANVQFHTTGKNVGTYQIYASGSTSTTNEVRLGKENTQYAFTMKIVPKDVYFKPDVTVDGEDLIQNGKIIQTFSNKNAKYSFADASVLVDGIVDGENVALDIEFYSDYANGVYAKYVGMGYEVKGALSDATNYTLHISTESGTTVTGVINYAPVDVVINNQTFTYGQFALSSLQYSYQFDIDGFDIQEYLDESGKTFENNLNSYDCINGATLSASNNLNVGEYSLDFLLTSSDFRVRNFIVDNVEQTTCTAKVTIQEKALSLVETGKTLKEIFTKKYDSTHTANIYDGTTLLFGLNGIVDGDDIKIASATYADVIGSPLQVTFVLGGVDAGNYSLSPYSNGAITPIEIGLVFDYDKDAIASNVTNSGRQEISALSYPFRSDAYLTSNSASSATSNANNFPTSLSGWAGHNFAYWTMEFGEVTTTQAEFLDELISSLNLTNMATTGYSIKVGNDSTTVAFLNALISDTTDVFGKYYYADNENISITFTPNWTITQQRLSVQLADENGTRNTTAGKVIVEVNDEKVEETTDNFTSTSISYGSKVVLKVLANAHWFYHGFFVGAQQITDGIGVDGAYTVLTINQYTADRNFVVRFEKQKVNVVIDLSANSSATISSSNFTEIENNKYQWSTDYFTLDETLISALPTITLAGHSVSAYAVGEARIAKENFSTTKMSSLLNGATTTPLTLTLVPTFEPADVAITLDYGYDDLTESLSLKYGQAYNSSADWEEEPARTGYTFLGWFNGQTQVTGEDDVSTIEAHTLTAKWEIKTFDISLTCENAEISNFNVTFSQNGNIYTATGVEFGAQITFMVTPNRGYQVSTTTWPSDFAITQGQDGAYNVTLTVPDSEESDVSYTIPIETQENSVTIYGENLEKIKVFDITDEKSDIDITSGVFKILTGRKVRLEISAVTGYEFNENITISDTTGLSVEKEISNDVLIVEIEGIASDLDITIQTTPSLNKITLSFSDERVVEVVEVDGVSYTDLSTLPEIKIATDLTLIFYVKYKFGYQFDSVSSTNFDVLGELITEGTYAGYTKIVVSNISSAGTVNVTSKFAKYTLTVSVISYDSAQNVVQVEENKVKIDGAELTQIEKDYSAKVEMTYTCNAQYNFAGWSKNGKDIFSTDETMEYQILKDETIYAIFSALEYNITLDTMDYSVIYTEYNDPSKTQEVFTPISSGKYFGLSGEEISSLTMYYGAEMTIAFQVPKGYMFYGFGYVLGDSFVFLSRENKVGEKVEVTISSFDFGDRVINQIYMVVTSYTATIDISTKIDIDGSVFDDDGVGCLELVGKDAQAVNEYGYVDGTRVRYENGQKESDQHFGVVAYTGDIVYIKISMRKGYKLKNFAINTEGVYYSEVENTGEYLLYAIGGIVGGTERISIEVRLAPMLNIIDLAFINGGAKVDGGVFEIVDTNDVKMIWTSGQYFSAVSVSAYTDSTFTVIANIKLGYSAENLQIVDEDGIIVAGSVQFLPLSIADTGYTGRIIFNVANFFERNSVSIVVTPSKYTVNIQDGDATMVKIKNVAFGATLNISESNAQNIEILDNRISFVGGWLKLILTKANFNFEGYFTHENGAGVQYINSSGQVIAPWTEHGYLFETISGKYVLSGNAVIGEDGEIEISLYLYQSYLKTRIQFEFVPNFTTLTAQDVVSGVDYSNSWYYSTSPKYIEVSFNTNIYFTAPELAGYKFYKFVISQRKSDGTWLSDVVTYSNSVPWSTNEFDRIVECVVQVVYYAEVQVKVAGGEATFVITQDADPDTQAKILLAQGFVDTTMSFTIEAVAGEGYHFTKWLNLNNGRLSYNKSLTLTARNKVVLMLHVAGVEVTLDFSRYDTTHGQVLSVQTLSKDGEREEKILGGYLGSNFVVLENTASAKVGDEVTFVLSVDFGFAVTWNRSDIIFKDYKNGRFFFTMSISSADANKTISIIPTFQDEILSVYIMRKFTDNEIIDNAIDGNNVAQAGYATFNGKETTFFTTAHGKGIQVEVVTNSRYAVASVQIQNYGNVFANSEDFVTDDGSILLSEEFMQNNGIVGTIGIEIVFERLRWNDEDVETYDFAGRGTAKNPYKIQSVADLVAMMKLCNSGATNLIGTRYADCAYVLTANLNLGEKFWTPIGTSATPFDGKFDFKSHAISGISTEIFYDTVYYNALFGNLGENAKILNSPETLWWVYLVIGLGVGLAVTLVVLIILARNRKKRREELSRR